MVLAYQVTFCKHVSTIDGDFRVVTVSSLYQQGK